MLTELSLNVLDIAENSTRAKASLVKIVICAQEADDLLIITIEDNGCGMTEEQLAQISNPFFTSRTTRKVGLGIPFFKYAAEITGGTFTIQSQTDVGTIVTASFVLSHIDRMPMGDINSTIHNLIVYHPECDFIYEYTYNQNSFTLDTREFRKILGDVPFDVPEISTYIQNYLTENKQEIDQDALY